MNEILSDETFSIRLVKVDADDDFHSTSMVDGENVIIALNGHDKPEKQAARFIDEILNALYFGYEERPEIEVTLQAARLNEILPELNEHGRQELLEFAEAMMDLPEYQKAEIIDFPVGVTND